MNQIFACMAAYGLQIEYAQYLGLWYAPLGPHHNQTHSATSQTVGLSLSRVLHRHATPTPAEIREHCGIQLFPHLLDVSPTGLL